MQLGQLLVTSNCNLLLGTEDGYTFSVSHLNFSDALITVVVAHIFTLGRFLLHYSRGSDKQQSKNGYLTPL